MIFWQARRYGEDWSNLPPTDEFLSAEDKLGPEATATSAFKRFLFDLICGMLLDVYQRSACLLACLLLLPSPFLSDKPMGNLYSDLLLIAFNEVVESLFNFET